MEKTFEGKYFSTEKVEKTRERSTDKRERYLDYVFHKGRVNLGLDA